MPLLRMVETEAKAIVVLKEPQSILILVLFAIKLMKAGGLDVGVTVQLCTICVSV